MGLHSEVYLSYNEFEILDIRSYKYMLNVSFTRRTDTTFQGIIYHRHFPIFKRRWVLTIRRVFIFQVVWKLWTTKQKFFLIRQVYELSISQYLCTKVPLLNTKDTQGLQTMESRPLHWDQTLSKRKMTVFLYFFFIKSQVSISNSDCIFSCFSSISLLSAFFQMYDLR